ncbi:ZBT41 protein, partial [Polypterus senegalus]
MKKRRNTKQKDKFSPSSVKNVSSDMLADDCSNCCLGIERHPINPYPLLEGQKKHLCCTQYNRNFLQFLNADRLKPSSFCDLIIMVEGKQYTAHKVVVSFGSSYFNARLSKNPEMNRVMLDHVTDTAFQHLLEFLYTSEFTIYESEIPSLVEAAKFLDIIDAVNLLTSEGIALSTQTGQVVEETSYSVESTAISEDSGADPSSNQCTICSRRFCYRKSLENHLAKSHSAVLEGKSDEGSKTFEDTEHVTRRSVRMRKCPIKFGSDECSETSDDSSSDKTCSEEDKFSFSEEEDSESEDEENQSEGASSESDAQQPSDNENIDAEVPSQSFPEGLAPVIVHSANKKILKCPKCDKTFDRAGPFPCDICGRQFNDTGNRKRHIECTHGGKRKWTCFICGKSVRERLHLRVHHDDKRYECDECGKTFIRHDHLTKHKKIHSGEKPYKCQVCNQTFRIKKTLTKHMVIHSDARPFNCPHCNATFKRKDKLKYHIDHVHITKSAEQCSTDPSEEKIVSLIIPYDGKMYHNEAKQYGEQSKAYPPETKSILQNVSSEVCVPVALVPVSMPEVSTQVDLVRHTTPLPSQSHDVLPAQQPPQQNDYQSATDLVFLEKYTLTPQPASIVHPVRPEQILDPREQSILGTLLGLDTTSSVQNLTTAEHNQ